MIALEVRKNGKRVCIAGAEDLAVLSTNIAAVGKLGKKTVPARPGDTGFYEYRARAYHPGLGRFMSEDPLGFGAGDANLFRYCGNDPVNFNDPTGTIVIFSGDRRAINTAINYLSGSSTFGRMYSHLQSSSVTYRITTDYSFMNGSFGPSGITWNPGFGVLLTGGQAILSPAMVLAHEIAHD